MSFFKKWFKTDKPAGVRKVLTLQSRRLQLESLENRELLSVSPNDPEIYRPVVEYVSSQTVHEDDCCIQVDDHLTSIQEQSGNIDLQFFVPTSDYWTDSVDAGEYAYLSLDPGAQAAKATAITTDDRVYLNFAVLFRGDENGAAVPTSQADIYVDGRLLRSVSVGGQEIESGGLFDHLSGAGIDLGGLSAGTHTIKIVLDANGDVAETDEGNNAYSFDVTVAQAGTPVGVPSDIRVEATGSGTVRVSWDAVAGATHYEVSRKNVDGSWTVLSGGSGATEWYDVNPPCGEQTYSVRAFRNVAASAAAEASLNVAADLSNLPQLSSLPGATHTIYLDFDGHVVQNSYWNRDYGSTITIDVFDVDGDKTTFSVLEVELITNIWAIVAEYYSPFNVNVTTIDPGLDGLYRSSSDDNKYGIRACIGGTNVWYSGGGTTGGVAYLDSFGWVRDQDDPAFIFSESTLTSWPSAFGAAGSRLATQTQRKYYASSVAGTITHEVGHTLGLNHDGMQGVDDYYRGHYITGTTTATRWAPILGSGYIGANIFRQWSKGEYYNPTNTIEDDLAIIESMVAGLKTDTDGTIVFGSTSLTATAAGVIETTDDSDAFALTVDFEDDYTFTVTSGIQAFGGQFSSLYFQVGLVDTSTGTTIATKTASIDTLSLTFTETLAAGTYSLIVTGIGLGDPSGATSFNAYGGFSSYGSVGTYNIRATRTTAEVPAPQNVVGLQVGVGRIGLRWDAVDGGVAYNVYRKNTDNTYTLLETVTGTTALVTDLANGKATYVVTTVTDEGRESLKTSEITITVAAYNLPANSITRKTVTDGFLVIDGTAAADDVAIRDKAGDATKIEVCYGGETHEYAKSNVKVVVFNGSGNGDVFDARDCGVDVDIMVDGGAGNDLIYGGQGHNFLDGGDGDNRIVGGTGTNRFYNKGTGSSLFLWRSATKSDSWAMGHSNDTAGKNDAQLLLYDTDSLGNFFVSYSASMGGTQYISYYPWNETAIESLLDSAEYVHSVLGNFAFFRDNGIADGASDYRNGAVNLCLVNVDPIPFQATFPAGTVAISQTPLLSGQVAAQAEVVQAVAGLWANAAAGTSSWNDFRTISWNGNSLKPNSVVGDFANPQAHWSVKYDWAATVEYVLALAADPETATEVWHDKVDVVHGFLNSLIGQNLFGQASIVVNTDSLEIDLADGKTSLAEAVLYAKKDSVIRFNNTVTTIVLDGTAIPINKSLTIDGGSTVTFDADARSGVMEVRNGTVTLQNLTLTGALASSAVAVDSRAKLTLLGVLLTGNTTVNGVIENRATTTLINTVLYGNTGNAIRQSAGALTVSNSTITDNGKIVQSGGTLVVNNSIIAQSREADGDNLSVTGGSATVNASLIGLMVSLTGVTIADGSLVGTTGNAIDPKFTNWATGNLSLKADSPAVGAGNIDLLPDGITTDFAGNSRLTIGMLDLGAYQSTPAATLPSPAPLTANVTTNSVNLSWSASAGATGYRLQSSMDGTNWRTIQTLENVRSTQVNDLEPGTNTYFRVIAFNASIVSNPAQLATFITTPLNTPSDFRIAGATKDSVSLAWTDVTKETGYLLQYKKKTDSNWTDVALAADTVAHEIENLDSSTEYDFRLKAITDDSPVGDSAFTPVLSAKTDDIYETNNTLNDSSELGLLDRALRIDNLVMLDGNDYYRFELPVGGRTGSYVEIAFTHSKGDLNLQLLDAFGNVLATSDGTGNTERIDISSRVAGVYHVRVFSDTTNPEYSLSINVPTVPAVPTGLTLQSITANTASFTWDSAADAGEYRLEYSVDGTTWLPGAIVAHVAGATQSGTISGLTPATEHHFRVVAINAEGNAESEPSEVVPGTTKLDAPNHLAASGVTATSVTLAWARVDGATEYLLEYSLDGTTWRTGKTMVASPYSIQTGTVEGLDPATAYYFRVTALKNTIQSNPIQLATPVTTTFDVAVQLSVDSRSTDSIALSWRAIAAATAYRLEYKLSSSNTWTAYPTNGATTDGDIYELTIGSLNSGTAYDFRLSALKGAVESPVETLSEISTRFETPVGLTVPDAQDDQVTISWTAVRNEDRYEIAYSTDNENWKTASGVDISENGQTRIATISSLRGGTEYFIQVRALSNDVETASDWSMIVQTVTKFAAPLNFKTIETTATTVSFTWSKAAAATTYRLEYSTNGVNWTLGAELGNVPGYTLTGLLPETRYEFRLVATSLGETMPSEIVASTTALEVPIVSVTNAGLNSISISWVATDLVTGYRVECIGPNGTQQRTVSSSARTATFDGLKEGTEYKFHVTALCTQGLVSVESKPGIVIASTETATTVLDMPENLRSMGMSRTSLPLVWDAVAGATEYELQRWIGEHWQTVYQGNDRTFSDAGLAAGTSYTYRIRAIDDSGVSNYSDAFVARTADATALGKPVITSSEVVADTMTLQWTDLGADYNYVLFRNGVPVLSYSTETSYVDRNFSSSQNTYVVYAYDSTLEKWTYSPQKIVSKGAITTEILSHEILPSGEVRLHWADNGHNYVVFRGGVPVGVNLSDPTLTDATAKDGENWYVLYVAYHDANDQVRWAWSSTYVVTKNASASSSLDVAGLGDEALTILG